MENLFYLKSFWNFIQRNKLFTTINIFGFAVSLMFVVLLGLYLQREYSVDAFQAHKDRLYRLEYTGGAQFANDYTAGTGFSGPMARVLEDRFPDIEQSVRLTMLYDINLSRTEQEDVDKFKGEAFMTDSTFFSVFTLDYVEGSAQTAMRTSGEVVLAEATARRLFGNESAMGKPVRINDTTMIVSAVVRARKDSHLTNPSLYMPLDYLNKLWGGAVNDRNRSFIGTYLLLSPGSDLPARAAEIEAFLKEDWEYIPLVRELAKDMRLTPVRELYWSSLNTYYARTNNGSFLTVLVVVTLLILLFAVINYINLSVAQAGFRAKEAAMRRLLGGTKIKLFWSFVQESILVCAASLILGLGFANLFEPYFQQLLGTDVGLQDGATWQNVALLVGGVIVLGIVSGLVPATVLSRFQPIEVVRGTLRRKTKLVYSKVLIAFQYCITIALIGCTLTVMAQVRYMSRADLGFRTDHILTFNNPGPNVSAFIDRIKGVPGVEGVAQADGGPMIWGRSVYQGDREGQTHSLTYFQIDSSFLNLMGFEVLHETGPIGGWWVNETFWRRFGLRDGDVEYLFEGGGRIPIRGLLKDFHTEGLGTPIGEVILVETHPESYPYLGNVYVQVSAADPFGTRDRIGKIYTEMYGNAFDPNFYDHWLETKYESQRTLIRMLGILSLLAVVISALGMLAMATYFARQRAGEVAVRKVFGAMTGQVLSQLMFGFLKLVVIAFVAAVPVIWYLMRGWLMEFAYRIEPSWPIFALAGLTAFVIAGLTVLGQSLWIATRNPVRSLKSE